MIDGLDDLIPYSTQRWLDECDLFHPARTWRKLRNVARWVPVLWADVDWDYTSLYEVIRFKLRNMREHEAEHRMHADWEETAAQMLVAERCMARLLADDYLAEEWAAHGAAFPDRPMVERPSGMYERLPMSDEERAAFTGLYKEQERLQQLDIEEFAHVFVTHSRGWWC